MKNTTEKQEKQLFQIRLLHDYYGGSSGPDLSIRPTPDCKDLMNEHQMLAKPSTGGIQVIAVDDASQTPFGPLLEGKKLSFFLDLQNPCFKHFTALDEPPANKMHRFSNTPPNQESAGNMHRFSNTPNQETLYHDTIAKVQADADPAPFALVEIQVKEGWFSTPIQEEKKFVIHFKAKALTSYQPLLQIRLLHDYYQGYYEGCSCPDLSIRPTPACEKLLKRHRMLAKASRTGIQVKTALDCTGEKPFLPLSEGTKLSFFLDLQNPWFKHFTALDEPPADNMHLFSNTPNDEPSAGNMHHICETPNEETLYHSEIAKVQAGADHAPFALVEIQVKEGLFSTPIQEKKFVIKFTAVKRKWKYYLIAPNSNNDKDYDYTIVDGSTNGTTLVDGSTNGKKAITFKEAEKVESPLETEDKVAKALLDEFKQTTYIITSKNVVASRAIGRKKIQLKKGEDTLILHLPNPSTSDQGIKILKL